MNGSPLARTLCFIAAWLCLLPLVYELAGSPQRTAPNTKNITSPDIRSAWVRFRFAHPPSAVSLFSNGKPLCRIIEPTGLDTELQIDLPLINATSQLELSVDWQDLISETVVELSLEPDGLSPRIFHFWAVERCREKVRIQW